MNLQILGFKGNIASVSDTLNYINSIKKDSEIIQLLNEDILNMVLIKLFLPLNVMKILLMI